MSASSNYCNKSLIEYVYSRGRHMSPQWVVKRYNSLTPSTFAHASGMKFQTLQKIKPSNDDFSFLQNSSHGDLSNSKTRYDAIPLWKEGSLSPWNIAAGRTSWPSANTQAMTEMRFLYRKPLRDLTAQSPASKIARSLNSPTTSRRVWSLFCQGCKLLARYISLEWKTSLTWAKKLVTFSTLNDKKCMRPTGWHKLHDRSLECSFKKSLAQSLPNLHWKRRLG